MIQAKFRCMGINHRLTATTVELKPVVPKTDTFPDGADENRRYWEATPSGEIFLDYRRGKKLPLELGSYYYVDIDRDEKGRLKLSSASYASSRMTLHFEMPWSDSDSPFHGSVVLGIDNCEAWNAFHGAAGSSWRLALREAHPETRHVCPYTSA